jgi:hypothetical protein
MREIRPERPEIVLVVCLGERLPVEAAPTCTHFWELS